MNPRFKVSLAGIDLLKDFEGFRSESARLPDGRWTVGYGHTKSARPGVTISEADASALLQYDLIEVTGAVNDLVFTPMTQNQFDSLVCFAFNIGVDAFRGSTVVRRINEGSMLQAAWSLEMWRKAEFEGQELVVDALVRRRAAEKALFLTPADGWVAAPSPVLPPRIDEDVCRAIPREKPVDLKASLVGSTATLIREDAPAAEPVAPVLAAAAASAVVFASEPTPEPGPTHEEVLAAPLPHRMADATQALSARLEAMAPSIAAGVEAHRDLDLPAPPEPGGEPAIFEAATVQPSTPALSEPVLFERPVVQSRWLPDPISHPQAEPEHEPAQASADLFQGPIFREQSHDVDFDVAEVEPAKLGFAPFLVLAFVGLVIFAAAATWAFNARSSGGLVNPITVGVGFALVGVACVGWAVYSLLSKFGEWEE